MFLLFLLLNHILRFQKMLDWILLIFIAKISNKRELQEIVQNQSDISTKDFTNINRKYTIEPYSFLVIDTALASDNPLRFKKLFLEYNKNHDS